MKTVYISDLEPGQQATGTFLVQHKEIRYKRSRTGADSGDPFLSLTLSDRTGDLDAKMWDNVAGVMLSFEQDDFVEVKGVLQIHNNRKQFTIHRLQKIDGPAVDLADFLPCSRRDPEVMRAELRGFIESVSNPHLRSLLELIFGDDNIVRRYVRAPAGKSVHHACIGGLLEHVLSVCEMCSSAARQYKIIDRDLLITGALLHDIGKIEELSYGRSFGYTTEGQLLGHIAIGMRIVGDKIRELPDFPVRLRTVLEHMILSHHGELEFGSPKVPMFPEAMLLHYLEDLDAKMDCMRRVIEQDSNVEGHWTGYSAPLERTLLKKDAYMSGPAAAETAAPAAPATLEDLAARLQVHFRGGKEK
ncbi:MAG: 3'-5' exoribonuclease YhaM family protein [bacterium]|jgi:3'-5' exoribonuclease